MEQKRQRGRPRGAYASEYAAFGGVFGYRKFKRQQERALRLKEETENSLKYRQIITRLKPEIYNLLVETEKLLNQKKSEVLEAAIKDYCTEAIKETKVFKDFIESQKEKISFTLVDKNGDEHFQNGSS